MGDVMCDREMDSVVVHLWCGSILGVVLGLVKWLGWGQAIAVRLWVVREGRVSEEASRESCVVVDMFCNNKRLAPNGTSKSTSRPV